MNVVETEIPEVLLLKPNVFEDDRGYFFESFRQSWLPDTKFVQDNLSSSIRSTLRGIHYQLNAPQGKLVQVIVGEVLDVAVDLRRSSVTFGHWVARTLNDKNHHLLWIPPGFGHGFIVLSDQAVFQYKCTDYYAPEDQHIIRWDDPELNIDWKIDKPILSERDANGKELKYAEYFS